MEYYKNLSLEDLFYINDDGLVCCEEWTDVVGHEGKYKISNLYRVKSLSRFIKTRNQGQRIGRDFILQQYQDKNTKHLKVKLSLNGINKTFGIHVIVARNYIPNPLNLPLVEHLNDIPFDNRPENLIWSTHKKNTQHAFERGLMKGKKGDSHGRSKLKEWQVLEIRSSSKTQKELVQFYNVSQATISDIKLNRIWKHI
jgi:hypothetical protein